MRKGMLVAAAMGALGWQAATAQPPMAPPTSPLPVAVPVQTTTIALVPQQGTPSQIGPAINYVPAPGYVAPASASSAADCGCADGMGLGGQRPPQMWAEVDYVLWRLRAMTLPPATLTTGSPADAIPGAVGQAHTQIIQGATEFNFERSSGARVTAGWALTADGQTGVELSGFLLELAVARQDFISNTGTGNTYLPYVDENGVNQALPFTVPGTIAGSSFAKAESRLWGAEANVYCGSETQCGEVEVRGRLLAGIRYLDLADKIVLRNQLYQIANPNITAVGEDAFSTRNQFLGGQFGAKVEAQWGAWTVEGVGKLAAGNVHQTSMIWGSPRMEVTGGGGTLLPGPLLALNSNIGRQSADRFTLIPEVGAKLRLDLGDYLALSVGYNFLWWNDILAPGEQMDARVNVTQLPNRGPYTGPGLPEPRFQRSSFFAHGITAGVEVRY